MVGCAGTKVTSTISHNSSCGVEVKKRDRKLGKKTTAPPKHSEPVLFVLS